MKTVKYELGAGPHVALRVEHASGVVDIKMFNGAVTGSGNDARAAASHLAEQLRTLAYYVEAHEGIRAAPVADDRSLVVALPANLVHTIDKYLDTDWKGHDSIAPLNAVAYIGERVAAIRRANR